MQGIVDIFTEFVTAFGALSTAILASALFLLPVGIKFTGRAIGFVKSLMGTKGGRKGR
jgi:hypothetical protein